MASSESPYNQSRAALRKIYGARSIDAKGYQSDRDTTPSGRQKFLEQQGMSPAKAVAERNADWRATFGPQMQPEDFILPPIGTPDPNISQPKPIQRTGFATPEDILDAYQGGAVSGDFQTPFGPVSFGDAARKATYGGVTPASTIPASAMSEFLPSQPRGYMSSVLNSASKWSKPLTRYG